VCMNVYSCSTFHLAVFLIPKGCSLPLHDHPKVLQSEYIQKIILHSLSVLLNIFSLDGGFI
jgi:hypothetical protein